MRHLNLPRVRRCLLGTTFQVGRGSNPCLEWPVSTLPLNLHYQAIAFHPVRGSRFRSRYAHATLDFNQSTLSKPSSLARTHPSVNKTAFRDSAQEGGPTRELSHAPTRL